MISSARQLAFIPSPSTNVWHIGPVPIRAYALCIIAGVVVAMWVTQRRLSARGGPAGAVLDIAFYAVPAGIVGARLYHVITTPDPYFGVDGHPLDAFKIWEGGLGIWGAIAGGGLGAWWGCRRLHLPLTMIADCLAPGLALGQAVGRFGNWFNQELYGKATTLPWGLKIDADHRLDDHLTEATYHPTFLYESLWCLGVALFVWWVDRRWRLGRGRAFALYAMAYVTGRAWIEYLRIDTAHHFLGLRLNDWTCLVVFVAALVYFVLRRGEREQLAPIALDDSESDNNAPGARAFDADASAAGEATSDSGSEVDAERADTAATNGESDTASKPSAPRDDR